MILTSPNKRPLRILHVVGNLNRGGIETWLMHVLRHIDHEQFQLDFLVETTEAAAYDDEARALGSQIIPCLHPSRPWQYTYNFSRIMREYGPYDIIHSHIHHYSGYVLRLAHAADILVRIAHSHNDTSALDARAGMNRRLYLNLTKRWIRQYATIGLAASEQAGIALFGADWKKRDGWRVLYCGIDLRPFATCSEPAAVRAEFGIPPDAFVIGHVGRFDTQKNHTFLVDIMAEVVKHEPRARLLLVGDGGLRPQIEAKIAHCGLQNHVVLAGARSDVSRLMLGAMDIFVLPSHHEGLPIVGIEAQAAGLPMIISKVVSDEMDVLHPLVQRLSPTQPASAWADAVMAAHKYSHTIDQKAAFRSIQQSPFNVQKSTVHLEQLYQTAVLREA